MFKVCKCHFPLNIFSFCNNLSRFYIIRVHPVTNCYTTNKTNYQCFMFLFSYFIVEQHININLLFSYENYY